MHKVIAFSLIFLNPRKKSHGSPPKAVRVQNLITSGNYLLYSLSCINISGYHTNRNTLIGCFLTLKIKNKTRFNPIPKKMITFVAQLMVCLDLTIMVQLIINSIV